MTGKESILKEIESMPEALVDRVLEYIVYLRSMDEHGHDNTALASESSLKKDWLKPEEDEAWKNL